jgi:hypothetical protein
MGRQNLLKQCQSSFIKVLAGVRVLICRACTPPHTVWMASREVIQSENITCTYTYTSNVQIICVEEVNCLHTGVSMYTPCQSHSPSLSCIFPKTFPFGCQSQGKPLMEAKTCSEVFAFLLLRVVYSTCSSCLIIIGYHPFFKLLSICIPSFQNSSHICDSKLLKRDPYI